MNASAATPPVTIPALAKRNATRALRGAGQGGVLIPSVILFIVLAVMSKPFATRVNRFLSRLSRRVASVSRSPG